MVFGVALLVEVASPGDVLHNFGLHNQNRPNFCLRRSAFFVRYLEDHTGTWATGMGFDEEREMFEAAGFSWDKFAPEPPLPRHPYVVMELAPGKTLHAAMGWGHEPGADPPYTLEEKAAFAEQGAEALEYLSSFGLIHRDFRTTNLIVHGRGELSRICVIDMGHTIAAVSEGQRRNRSPVVKCSWRESKTKRFDWAPAEVKEASVNFARPVHAFDVYSLGVLVLQFASGGISAARAAAARLANEELGGALGLDDALLRRMLGPPAERPNPFEVRRALLCFHRPHAMRTLLSPHSPRARSRSRSGNRGVDPAPWRVPGEEWELVDELSAAAYGTDTEALKASGSDTEPE